MIYLLLLTTIFSFVAILIACWASWVAWEARDIAREAERD